MSAIGILRSFAEARCADHEPIPARLTYGTIREVLRIIEEWERSARKPTNETTPDAVEAALCKMYRIIVCDYGALSDMTVTATLALEGFLAERARHAEEVASHRAHAGDLDDVIVAISRQRDHLRDQLRKVEGERDEALRMVDGLRKSEKTARESMVINMRLRDEAQAENVRLKAERDALRSLLPDVRACAEYCRNILIGPPGLAPVALAAHRILAAIREVHGLELTNREETES